MSKRSILLSSRDRRELLLCCLLGIGAVLLVDLLVSLSLLLLRQPQILTLPMVGLVLGLSVGLGVLLGLLVFLRRELLQPINTLLTALPRRLNQRQTLPWASLELDAGIAPLQLLAYRINRLLESLRSTSESRQQRLDGLAHDIRGPLTRLLHRIEWLEAQGGADPQVVAGLQADLQALLDLDRELDAIAIGPALPSQRQRVELDGLCRKLAQSYGAGQVQVSVPPLQLWVDRHLLRRSLNNLIDNALEYGAPPVVLSLRQSAHHLEILVDDHGAAAGAGPSLPRIHRGLGLAIATSFCRQHGGTLALGRSPLGGLQVQLQISTQALVDGDVP
jgi:two-component system osmolarity sensor histidine kinase EnvZ